MVERSAFAVPVMARFVLVAFVVVEFCAFKFAKFEVEEANKPPCAQIGDDVAAARTP